MGRKLVFREGILLEIIWGKLVKDSILEQDSFHKETRLTSCDRYTESFETILSSQFQNPDLSFDITFALRCRRTSSYSISQIYVLCMYVRGFIRSKDLLSQTSYMAQSDTFDWIYLAKLLLYKVPYTNTCWSYPTASLELCFGNDSRFHNEMLNIKVALDFTTNTPKKCMSLHYDDYNCW